MGWIGVDMDGTCAHYPDAPKDKWAFKWSDIGGPIVLMMNRIRTWVSQKQEVRIVTARVFPYIHGAPNPESDYAPTQCLVSGEFFTPLDMVRVIQAYTLLHVGKALPVTCAKDYHMIELWDDRAVQVVPNTGRTLAEEHEAVVSALRGKAQG